MATTPARIRAVLPPGGFANAVGVYLAALDNGLEEMKARARKVPAGKLTTKLRPDVRSPAEVLLHAAEIEGRWVHAGIGGQKPSPPTAPAEALFAHLDAVRKASAAVLRPLGDRDLDTLRTVEGKEGKSTVRRILFELLEHQAHHRGQVGLLARLLS